MFTDKDIIMSKKSKEVISLDSRLQALERFHKQDFGGITPSEVASNLERIQFKHGSVYGIYMTPDGDIFILAYVFPLQRAFIYTSHEQPFFDLRSI